MSTTLTEVTTATEFTNWASLTEASQVANFFGNEKTERRHRENGLTSGNEESSTCGRLSKWYMREHRIISIADGKFKHDFISSFCGFIVD